MDINKIFKIAHTSFKEDDFTKVDIDTLDFKALDFKSKDEFLSIYKDLDIQNNLYYTTNDIISRYFYIDYNNSFYIELFDLTKKALNFINLEYRIKAHKKTLELNNYYTLYLRMIEKFRLLDFSKNYKRIPKELMKDCFSYCYSSIDYGYDILDKECLEYVFNILRNNNKNKKDKEIIIYRGMGSISRPLEKAYSWTKSPEVAKFFANRFNERNPKIYRGKINQKDIIYELEQEEEIFCEYKDIKDIELLN